MSIAHVGDIDIHYEVIGEQGPPVLLIMGLGARGDQWTPMARAFAGAGFRAIHFDNRDVGRSTRCEGRQYGIADMAQDALGLLDHLGVERCHVAGISMGGMIAQELMLRAPSRVLRAALIATLPGGPNTKTPDPAMVARLFAMGGGAGALGPAESLADLYRAITGPGFGDAHPELIEMAVAFALSHPTAPDALGRQMAAAGSFSAWDRLPASQTPTLVVHGDADPLIPYENGVLLSKRIPGARLHTLPGVGHLVPLEAPVEMFGALSDFFQA
jgi:pimeloyl-ACP methyl ester carboxylesterase